MATDKAIMDAETIRMLADEAADMQVRQKIAGELVANDPRLDYISAIIIAGDKMSADRADKFLEAGMPFDNAYVTVGSYARLDFLLKGYETGKVSLDYVLDRLPDEWRGSDPDDTDPRFLKLWQQAFVRNNFKYIRDGKPLPRGDGNRLVVYRGQDDANGNYGIAWTLDPKIAEKFANGAATRQRNRDGKIIMATIDRKKVMAYLTLRGESEVILDPKNLWVIP